MHHQRIEQRRGLIEAASAGAEDNAAAHPIVPAKRLLIIESELARVFQIMRRDGNVLSAVLREAWDGSDLRTMTRRDSRLLARNPHVSLVAHITQDELQGTMRRVEQSNGFANRVLWIAATRARLLPHGGGLQDAQLEPFVRLFRDVDAWAKDAGEIKFDRDAYDLWSRAYADLSRAKPGYVGAVVARAEAQARRLALIYAIADRATEVRCEHLHAGIAAWKYAESSAELIFGAERPPLETKLLKAIIAEPEISASKLHEHTNHHQKKDDVANALAALERDGLIVLSKSKTAGRPVTRYSPAR